MKQREEVIELLAQTIAPTLYLLSGDKPSEMGFPIEDSKEAFDERMERQFNPVEFWLDKARKIAGSLVVVLEAGGLDIRTVTLNDAMCEAAGKQRPDVKNGRHETLPL